MDDLDLSKMPASVLIVSDALFSGGDYSEDLSGPKAIDILSDFGFESINLDYYPDDFSAIKGKIETDVSSNVRMIILIGGTGLSPKAVTTEAVQEVIEKHLRGFGEEFRRQGYKKIGGQGLLSRAIAGVIEDSLVVALPNSPEAVELGLNIVSQILPSTFEFLNSE